MGRCGNCEGCRLPDCGICVECRRKRKFGGDGSSKQACIKRFCEGLLCPPPNMLSANGISSTTGPSVPSSTMSISANKLDIQPPSIESLNAVRATSSRQTKHEINQPYNVRQIKIDECGICGNLQSSPSIVVVCDGCNADFHLNCLGMKKEDIPEDTWYCPYCFEWEDEDPQPMDWAKAYDIYKILNSEDPSRTRSKFAPPPDFWIGRSIILRDATSGYQMHGRIVGYENEKFNVRIRNKMIRRSSFFLHVGSTMHREQLCQVYFQSGKSALMLRQSDQDFINTGIIASAVDGSKKPFVETVVEDQIKQWGNMEPLPVTHPLTLSSRDERMLPPLRYDDSVIFCRELASGVDRLKILAQLEQRGVKRSRETAVTMKCTIQDNLGSYWGN